jgi:hypothetical protein
MTKHAVGLQTPPLVDDERFNRNGMLPSASAARRLANGFNSVSSRYKKQVLLRSQRLGDVDVSSGGIVTLWPFAFGTGENTSGLTLRVGQALVDSLGGAGSGQLEIREMATGLLAHEVDLDFSGLSSTTDVAPGDVHHATHNVPGLDPNTEYFGHFFLFGGARIIYASVVENAGSAIVGTILADDSLPAVCNPGELLSEAPIYDAQVEDLREANNELWRHNGSHLLQWSKDVTATTSGSPDSPLITATTYENVEDGSTAVTAATIGVTLVAEYHNTSNRTTIPVRLAVQAGQTVGSGNVLSVKLTNGTDSIEMATFVDGPGNWCVVSATMPATAAKWDLYAKVDGGTFRLNAVCLWEYEP